MSLLVLVWMMPVAMFLGLCGVGFWFSMYHWSGAVLTEDERSSKHLTRISEQVTLANEIITQLLNLIHDRPLARTSTLDKAWKPSAR